MTQWSAERQSVRFSCRHSRDAKGMPVIEVISATHIIANLTLGLGKVIYDYLR
jgi:acetoacetate decarboxylase